MTDILLMLAIWWGPVLILVGGLALTGRISVEPKWLIISLTAYFIYVAAIFSGVEISGISVLFADSAYNWSGKILSLFASLLMIASLCAVSERATPTAAGMKLKQAPGSLGPALGMTAAMIAFMIGLQLLAGDGSNINADTLLYQATMPGLDEEVFFRGLLLMTLAIAVTRPDGTNSHWAAILATLLFALGHGIFVDDGQVQFEFIAIIYTGILGAAMMWIRVRTGSILMPIIAHNLTNLAGQLV